MSGDTPPSRLLTVEQLAERLLVGRTTAYELAGRIPGRVYLGRLIRIPEHALEGWLERGGDRPAMSSATRPASPAPARRSSAANKATERWLDRLDGTSSAPARSPRPRS